MTGDVENGADCDDSPDLSTHHSGKLEGNSTGSLQGPSSPSFVDGHSADVATDSTGAIPHGNGLSANATGNPAGPEAPSNHTGPGEPNNPNSASSSTVKKPRRRSPWTLIIG